MPQIPVRLAMRIVLRDSTLEWMSIRDGVECFFPVGFPGGDQPEEMQCACRPREATYTYLGDLGRHLLLGLHPARHEV